MGCPRGSPPPRLGRIVIVVDASALAAFLLKEPGWERLARYIEHSISVDMAAKEVANTIRFGKPTLEVW